MKNQLIKTIIIFLIAASNAAFGCENEDLDPDFDVFEMYNGECMYKSSALHWQYKDEKAKWNAERHEIYQKKREELQYMYGKDWKKEWNKFDKTLLKPDWEEPEYPYWYKLPWQIEAEKNRESKVSNNWLKGNWEDLDLIDLHEKYKDFPERFCTRHSPSHYLGEKINHGRSFTYEYQHVETQAIYEETLEMTRFRLQKKLKEWREKMGVDDEK